ncbi:heparan-alpha-glucosaminide N-acetyltransferase domain-containing protein [Sphingomonas sp. PP-CC-3A-396]|uniref:DUF1624 domain-containing protein n=1 Tax=Sphingomonas sp. PP-CC-3A-396 TaxID=2135655 RepID=UPI0010E3815D|nr:heparan-alpha-glucosaminide N-acetyltransferase domain-containing protein [Sphingomonas sp. PP-CC-3A-396]TCQ07424.1 putative membrane protein [Sphingomonas sp. PP-CC-3A-396]
MMSMTRNAAAVSGGVQGRIQPIAVKRQRIVSIDALRGLVMLVMLVDHTREFFYLHAQVSDPMTIATTPPGLFFSRLAAHVCAPVFVLLTGLAAWLYAEGRALEQRRAVASSFLLKRGLFLVALEWTIVNFAWTFDPTPAIVYLQVIWAIGLSMIALAAIVHLPRTLVVVLGLAIVLGHNLLDPIAIAPGEQGHAIWAVLHDRGLLDLPFGGQARTSYPVLPWIGVIALGWSIGPWFAQAVDRVQRRSRLLVAGGGALALFAILRTINGYGEPLPWQDGGGTLATVMSYLNLTKYPPSADFLLLTLGTGVILLSAIDRMPARVTTLLAVFGSAPLFFYILHLYAVHALNIAAGLVLGMDGKLVSVPNVAALWLVAALVAVPCWFACRSFAAFKRTRTGWWWRYL